MKGDGIPLTPASFHSYQSGRTFLTRLLGTERLCHQAFVPVLRVPGFLLGTLGAGSLGSFHGPNRAVDQLESSVDRQRPAMRQHAVAHALEQRRGRVTPIEGGGDG